MEKKLLRLKVNGIRIANLSLVGGNMDFLVSLPNIRNGNVEVCSHLTLHTKTGRLTCKTTHIKEDGVDLLPDLLRRVEVSDQYKQWWTPNGLDSYGNKHIIFNSVDDAEYLTTIALNGEGIDIDKMLEGYFGKIKTPDSKFEKIKDITLSKGGKEKLMVSWKVAKNTQDLDRLIKGLLGIHEDVVFSSSSNRLGDSYTHFFCIDYKFVSRKSDDSSKYDKLKNF